MSQGRKVYEAAVASSAAKGKKQCVNGNVRGNSIGDVSSLIRFKEIQGAGHNDIGHSDEWLPAMKSFVEFLESC